MTEEETIPASEHIDAIDKRVELLEEKMDAVANSLGDIVKELNSMGPVLQNVVQFCGQIHKANQVHQHQSLKQQIERTRN